MINQHKKLMTFLLTGVLISSVFTPAFASVTSARIAGVDRYATADLMSNEFTAVDTVVIAAGSDFANALCATTLAKKYNSPLFLTSSTSISTGTLTQIKRIGATKAIIVADQGTVNSSVDDQLKSAGLSVSRIGGVDRYATSVLVAKQLGSCTKAIVACGTDFPDALSIASIASQLNMPIILSNKNAFSDEAMSFLLRDNQITKTYIVGGTGVLSSVIDAGVRYPVRLAGADRYATGLAILKEFSSSLNFNNIYLATGNNFADALAGAPLAGKSSSPIILVGAVLGEDVNAYIRSHITASTKVTSFGGNAVVADTVVNSVVTGVIPVAPIITGPDFATPPIGTGNVIVLPDPDAMGYMPIKVLYTPGAYSITIPEGMTVKQLSRDIKLPDDMGNALGIRKTDGKYLFGNDFESVVMLEGYTLRIIDLHQTLKWTEYTLHIAK